MGGGGQGEASPKFFSFPPKTSLECSCDCIDWWAYSFPPKQKLLDRTLMIVVYLHNIY